MLTKDQLLLIGILIHGLLESILCQNYSCSKDRSLGRFNNENFLMTIDLGNNRKETRIHWNDKVASETVVHLEENHGINR
jgi:hypothetical protein